MENVKNDSNIYPSFSLAFFFYRLSRFCEATESHSRTHAPPSSLPNKSSSYGRYIRSINSSQQGQLISKQNVMSQLAAVQHKFFNSNMGALFFCHFPLQSTHTGPRAQNYLTFQTLITKLRTIYLICVVIKEFCSLWRTTHLLLKEKVLMISVIRRILHGILSLVQHSVLNP